VTGLLGKPGGKGYGQPQNQDIPTREEFLCDSVRKEPRFKVCLTDSFSRVLRERVCPAEQRGRPWAAALRKKYYFEFSSVLRGKKKREVGSLLTLPRPGESSSRL